MDAARPVGRRVPRLGRARRLPRDRARARPTGRMLRVPADALRELVERVVPVRRAPHRGACSGTARTHRGDGAAARGARRARHAGGRAGPRDQQPGRGRHPRGRRAAGRLRDAALLAAPARRSGGSRPTQFVALDALRREIDAAGGAPGPAGARRPRGGAVDWLDRRTASSATGSSPRRSPRPASTSPGASGRRRVLDGDGAGARRWSGWRARCRVASAAGRGEGVDPARSPSWSRAVKSYSQMDRASLQRIDVTEGLESTLVMLGHKLRDGVTVVRDYGADVPRIEAYAGELNQVWTNLIDNAVDAMDGAGTLRVTTRADGDARRRRGRRHRARHAARGGSARVRAVLHDQGRRQGHRPRPRHLPPHRRRAARRHDRHRLATGRHASCGSASLSDHPIDVR